MNNKKFIIKSIRGREILDSRGNPTVEVDVITETGIIGRAAVPSGASTGIHEAIELRDGDKNYYFGKGVKKAISNIDNIIAPKLSGKDVRDQRELDTLMISLDGTENKSHLGANAILGVSLALSRAAAKALEIPLYKYISENILATNNPTYILPVPLMNVINGGKHAGNKLAIQEFMIIPHGGKTFAESLRMGVETYHSLKELLLKKYGKSAINVGDEGGFAPPLEKTSDALTALLDAIELAGYVPKKEISLGIDVAASVFYNCENKTYHIDGKEISSGELIDYYLDLTKVYPLVSIEDPFEEEDFEMFAEFTSKVNQKIQVVGDDIFVTNKKRLAKGISLGAANALLLKVNQIGTLTEAIETAQEAISSSYSVIVSHRSGETEDPYIADLTVALSTGQIKAGAPARSDRTSKYNQLLRIEEQIKGSYAGAINMFSFYK